jgi:glycosyltransferase involved in cell wall biosynthesis
VTSLRVLVMTVVHHPQDTRILVRQISALVDAGHQVTYAAPFSAQGVTPPPGVHAFDLPRSRGRHRLGAVRAARRTVRELAAQHDVVLIHDPELVLSVAGVTDVPIVWDVHEDTAAAVSYKDWIPAGFDRAAAAGVRLMERWAERRLDLILAESGYVDRFRLAHPVVPNSTLVDDVAPPSGTGRVVCVSTLTRARGTLDLIEVGRLLRPAGIVVDLIGPASPDVSDALRRADIDGDVRWYGRLPHGEVMERMRGATAGLSLLHNERNYRHSYPTKVFEYLAQGLPVVATPLPLVVEVLQRLRMGRNGIAAVRSEHNWADDAPVFVAAIEEAARRSSRGRASSRLRRPQ